MVDSREEFGPGFLNRVLDATERIWADPYLGLGWQPGTRWRGALGDAEVEAIERRFNLQFPPDYRLFLQTLHTTDPECVRYQDGTIREHVGRPFHDWVGDRAPIDRALAWPTEGLVWSVEADDGWIAAWGKRPTAPNGVAERVSELVAAGPPLIPLMGHHYLVGRPQRSGNPVLSIYGADVIVYAPTFGAWLVKELGSMVSPELRHLAPAQTGDVTAIPFWQDVIDGDWARDIR